MKHPGDADVRPLPEAWNYFLLPPQAGAVLPLAWPGNSVWVIYRGCGPSNRRDPRLAMHEALLTRAEQLLSRFPHRAAAGLCTSEQLGLWRRTAGVDLDNSETWPRAFTLQCAFFQAVYPPVVYKATIIR